MNHIPSCRDFEMLRKPMSHGFFLSFLLFVYIYIPNFKFQYQLTDVTLAYYTALLEQQLVFINYIFSLMMSNI